MMEGNSRRKAKLTIINNQCVNEDVCIELLSTGSSNTDDADDLGKVFISNRPILSYNAKLIYKLYS